MDSDKPGCVEAPGEDTGSGLVENVIPATGQDTPITCGNTELVKVLECNDF